MIEQIGVELLMIINHTIRPFILIFLAVFVLEIMQLCQFLSTPIS